MERLFKEHIQRMNLVLLSLVLQELNNLVHVNLSMKKMISFAVSSLIR